MNISVIKIHSQMIFLGLTKKNPVWNIPDFFERVFIT